MGSDLPGMLARGLLMLRSRRSVENRGVKPRLGSTVAKATVCLAFAPRAPRRAPHP